MIVSMTGFGRGTSEHEQFSVTVELKTVNHRFTEYNIRMPRQFLKLEDRLKKKIGEHVQRGKVDGFITTEGVGNYKAKINVNWPLLDEYYESILAIQNKYQLQQDVTLYELLKRDDFISITEVDSGNELIEQLVLDATEKAVLQLKQMRVAEGEMLAKDLLEQLTILKSKIVEVRQYAPKVIDNYTLRLQKRMDEMSNGLIDEARIINEIAIFADKADINEELTRLESHMEQFRTNMKRSDPVGRKLDFLLQEMNREVNTIGSKANDSMIAIEVVEMKSLLEKMKEQVQNIE